MIKELRGYLFFGKPLRLSFAQKDSDFIAKLKGSFDSSVLKKRKAAENEGQRLRDLKLKRKMIDKVIRLRMMQQSQVSGESQLGRSSSLQRTGGGMSGGMSIPEVYKILFIEKIPKNVKQETLEDIFGNYNGFVEVRLISEKGYAFVEYLSDDYAAYALQDVKSSGLLRFEDAETGIKVEARINFGKKP